MKRIIYCLILVFSIANSVFAENFLYYGAPTNKYLVNIEDSVLTAKTATSLGKNVVEHTFIINRKTKQLIIIAPEYSCKENGSYKLTPKQFIKYDTLYVDIPTKTGLNGTYYSVNGSNIRKTLNLSHEYNVYGNTKHKAETGNIVVSVDVYSIGNSYTTAIASAAKETITVRDFYLCYTKRTPENNFILILNDINLLSILNNYMDDEFRNYALTNKSAKLIPLD